MNEHMVIAILIFSLVIVTAIICTAIVSVDRKHKKEPLGTIHMIFREEDNGASPEFCMSFNDREEFERFLDSGKVVTCWLKKEEVKR